ncbi:receptor-like protein 6 [Corylus avellana]|uniref:receptor-like protein 6 n=1 Tax=Corylus avellana TaxID=13451 RepID=UPI00286B15C5|nr:receptor-like protein 6 [Corylus avellana]
MICLVSTIGFCIFAVSGQCLGNQQSLLLQLKNSLVFDGASSTKLVHWNQSVDCCPWEGVSCNEGHVIGLDLTNESISGRLDNSSSLFGLQYLQHLGLASNNFSSEIPSQFDKLMNLRCFNISNACFKGQIPIAISHLTRFQNLTSLILSSCGLNGTFPEKIFQIPTLEKLDISSNGLLQGSLPEFPWNGSLRKLMLHVTNFSGTLPKSIVLNFSFNQLVGQIPLIKQFATFSETSYEGNIGLFGLPLKEKCTCEKAGLSPPTSEETHSNFGNAIDWNFLSAELGFVFGFGIVIGTIMFWKRTDVAHWHRLSRILRLYEQASGQKLNVNKTAIFFSRNTSAADRDAILAIAAIPATQSYDTYLGLPALVGKSRQKEFKSIIDRIEKRLNDWKLKFLSQAGKEILLKAVVQAIPTYSMSDLGWWDSTLLESLFSKEEVVAIQSIPLSNTHQEDVLIWRGTANGMFSVKSAYHLATEVEDRKKASSSMGLHRSNVWKRIWKLKIPSVEKNFIWRACQDILPTRDNLL